MSEQKLVQFLTEEKSPTVKGVKLPGRLSGRTVLNEWNGVHVPSETIEKDLRSLIQKLRNDTSGPFYYFSLGGDTALLGVRCANGSVSVYECRVAGQKLFKKDDEI